MLFKVTNEALAALLHGRKDEGHPEDQVMRVIWDEDDVAFELDKRLNTRQASKPKPQACGLARVDGQSSVMDGLPFCG